MSSAHIDARVYYNASEPLPLDVWHSEFESRTNMVEHYEKMQQEYSYVLFTPLELRENRDLALIDSILKKGTYATSVVRENSGNRFFLDRESLFFSTTRPYYYQLCCFQTSQFGLVDEAALRETVIVPECHTLSVDQFYNMLCWLRHNRSVIKRVVMLGSLHILGGAYDGQAFIDFLHAQDLSFRINRTLYNHDHSASLFATLLEKRWTQLDWHRNNEASIAMKSEYLRGTDSILYSVRDDREFTQCVECLHRGMTNIRVQCLFKPPFGSHVPVSPSMTSTNALFRYMRRPNASTLKGAHFNSLDLTDLMNYERSTVVVAHKTPTTTLFLISRDTLRQLQKNELFLLFTLLDHLFVIREISEDDVAREEEEAAEEKNILETTSNQFNASRRVNLRYSYQATTLISS